MCTISGVVYAHKIIVQSEQIREIYISEYKKAFGNKLGDPLMKVVALGSPKYDKLLKARREDYPLPDGWEERLKGKKVVLYNSSLSAMLNTNENYFNKLRSMFELFSSFEDIVVWWLPHPLAQATYSSMRISLSAEYNKIVSSFKESAVGIYDDTPNLHCALVWSDAYYGDGSSLVALYIATKKPLLLQSTDIIYENSEVKLLPGYKAEEYEHLECNKPSGIIDNLRNAVVLEREQFTAMDFISQIHAQTENNYVLSEYALASQDGRAGERIYQVIKDAMSF